MHTIVLNLQKNCWELFGVGYILDRTVHSKLEQLVMHSYVCCTYSTLKNFQRSFCMQETNAWSCHIMQLLYSLIMGQ